MRKSTTFKIHAMWQGRRESPAEISRRLQGYIAMARRIMPPEIGWYGWTDDRFFNLEKKPKAIESFIFGGGDMNDEGQPDLLRGFQRTIPCFAGDPDKGISGPQVGLSVGSPWRNGVNMSTDASYKDTTDPRLITYDAMKTHMMAVVRSFEPDWCQAQPTELGNYLDTEVYNRPPMSLAWMIWLNPALAALVEPPRYFNTIIERDLNGGLFMVTSTETFDCSNTTHLRMARAIHRQIDPLNYTVPFCGQSGRSNRVPPFPTL